MQSLIAQYLAIAFGLLMAYIILTNGDKAVALVNSGSTANIGAIKAFQGR